MVKYICSGCGAQFELRCPDGPDCPLDHSCPHCKAEVLAVKHEVRVIEEADITGYSLMADGTIEPEGTITRERRIQIVEKARRKMNKS